jgi:hypothetical protein
MTELGQFHFEVLKRLHSMKSEKKLQQDGDDEVKVLDEARNLRQDSPVSCSGGFSCDDLNMAGSDSIDSADVTPDNLMCKLAKALSRNQELEGALKIKEDAIKKLLARNEELEQALKRKESVRLSQLELLALRNVELEKELMQRPGRSNSA